MRKPEPFTLKPIGYVHTEAGSHWVEILDTYRPALHMLGQFSHAHIIWWADQNDNPDARNLLQTELPYAPGQKAGVFACRAEYRPNPIGVTICFMIDVDEDAGIITLPWIDALDGTPVIDIKPYIPLSDRIRDVRVATWLEGWPMWMEDAAAFFAEEQIDLG
jgi:tRNA-Thr(GGU) m(6)t(6)A37 methyltransferase TsaA